MMAVSGAIINRNKTGVHLHRHVTEWGKNQFLGFRLILLKGSPGTKMASG